MIPNWVKQFPCDGGIYLLEERGDATKFMVPQENWVAENRTFAEVDIYDSDTNRLSTNSIYVDKDGDHYFKKNGIKHWLMYFQEQPKENSAMRVTMVMKEGSESAEDGVDLVRDYPNISEISFGADAQTKGDTFIMYDYNKKEYVLVDRADILSMKVHS